MFVYYVVSAIFLYRIVILGFLLGLGILDALFFTYINYTLDTLAYGALVLAMWKLPAYKFYVLFVLPLIYGTTIFVFLAIVVIVQMNDGVFLKTTVYNAGTRAVGAVHTGDWLIHYLPLVEIFVILLLLNRTAKPIFQRFYSALSTRGKVLYTSYFLLCSAFVLLLYMLSINFQKNYPTGLATGVVLAVTLVVGVVTELFLYTWYRSGNVKTGEDELPIKF